MIHRVKNAQRRLRGHRPSRDVNRAPLKLSRKLPIFVHGDGNAMVAGFEEGYLHPTKGIRKGVLPPSGFRWKAA